MDIFDFVAKAQKKLDEFQKQLETETPQTIFERLKPDPNAKSKKAKKRKSPKPVSTTDLAIKQTIAQRDSFIRNGFDQYVFIANRDCCEICGKLNGKHFSVRDLEIGVNAPPMHENCRCSIAAYSDRKEYEEWLNSL